MKTLWKYLLRGLVFVTPIGVTILLFISVEQWVQDKIKQSELPWYWILLVLLGGAVGLIVLGYIGSTILLNPIKAIFNKLIKRVPLINVVYTSIKDLMDAFVGDKKKFNKPVIVKLHKDLDEHKIGFITQEDLTDLGMPGMVCVYLPHSYALSGYVSVFPKENVKPMTVSGSDAMKFLVSGGVTKFDEDKK